MTSHDLTEAILPSLLDAFYERARHDYLIGTIFNDVVHDWPEHLVRIADFWSSVMLSSGRYKGNPVAKHMLHVGRLTPAMFERWLEIWKNITEERLSSELAQAMQTKAARIAESLQLAILHPSPLQKAMMESSAANSSVEAPE